MVDFPASYVSFREGNAVFLVSWTSYFHPFRCHDWKQLHIRGAFLKGWLIFPPVKRNHFVAPKLAGPGIYEYNSPKPMFGYYMIYSYLYNILLLEVNLLGINLLETITKLTKISRRLHWPLASRLQFFFCLKMRRLIFVPPPQKRNLQIVAAFFTTTNVFFVEI